MPCLKNPYSSLTSFLSADLLKAVPYLSVGRSLYDTLYNYFEDPKMTLSFTFQSKYLGMSPWDCPGLFAMLSYMEQRSGIYHVQGGLSRISQKMAETAQANGAKIHLGTPVRKLLVGRHKDVTGIELKDGEKVRADEVIINADFAHAMTNLVPDDILRKYRPEKLRKKSFSCSTYMMYLGLDKIYDMPHHTIVFADNYKRNVEEVFNSKILSDDISFYVRNASVTDATLAPSGKSAVYILVPVPNMRGEIDWQVEAPKLRQRVLDALAEKTSMTDIEKHIEKEHTVTPFDWEQEHDVYCGATFNLIHSLGQMLYFRPHNKFEELKNCYLVGGGTHPGSGLPTIYESGRIASDMISNLYGVDI
ncbi:MAG: phytoene desaturase family protein [Verrucomicrobiota bacterium]